MDAMKPIEIHCPQCDESFQVADDLAGLLVQCPHCRRQVSVPLPPAQERQTPRLKVKHESPITGGAHCPSCGASMEDGAVLCVQCGFHLRRGGRVGEAAGWPRALRWGLGGAVLILLAVMIRFFLRPSTLEQAIPPPMAQPVPATSAPAISVSPPAPPPEAAPPAVTGQPAGATAASPAEASPSQEELARRTEEDRVMLRARLDQTQPMVQPGDEVELRKNNGLVIRGQLKALTPEAAIVIRKEGEIAIPLTDLDRPSRVRCDRVIREHLIELQVKKRAQDR